MFGGEIEWMKNFGENMRKENFLEGVWLKGERENDYIYINFFFGWLYFFGCLSLFCFNWTSFFNKSIRVNLYKLAFSISPLFTPNQTKRREIKIFSILPLFHFNQTDPAVFGHHISLLNWMENKLILKAQKVCALYLRPRYKSMCHVR